MKLATLGLATALALTGTFALAQSGGGSTRRRIGYGWRSGDRHDDRIFRQRNNNR